MKLNDKCCDALGCRNEIQTELNRLNKLLADIMTITGVTSQDDILAAVRGVMAPEWISADLVRPTEPGWYWVLLTGCDEPLIAEYWPHFPRCEPCWLQPGDDYGNKITGTRYIKINQPVAK